MKSISGKVFCKILEKKGLLNFLIKIAEIKENEL